MTPHFTDKFQKLLYAVSERRRLARKKCDYEAWTKCIAADKLLRKLMVTLREL